MTVYTLRDIDLTGDGHGHHVPGTPMVYKHGWHPIATGDIKVGDKIRAIPSGTSKNRKTVTVTKMDAPGRTGKFVHGDQQIAKGTKHERTRKATMQLTHDHKVERWGIANMLGTVPIRRGRGSEPKLGDTKRHSLPIGGEGKRKRYNLPIGGEAKHPRVLPEKITLTDKGKSKGLNFAKSDPVTHRHVFNMTHEERLKMFKENGLKSQFPEIDTDDLLDAIKAERNPKRRKALSDELDARMKSLQISRQALDRADIDAARGGKRDYFKRYDAALNKFAAGRAVLRLRDRLLSDGSMDKMAKYGAVAGSFSKSVGMRVATATALTLLLGPLGGAAGLALGPAAAEAFHKTIETVVAHSGADALVERHLVEPGMEKVKKGGRFAAEKARLHRDRKIVEAKAKVAERDLKKEAHKATHWKFKPKAAKA